jgi:heat shock protein HslJ
LYLAREPTAVKKNFMNRIAKHLSVLLLIVLTACGGIKSAGPDSLYGWAWELEYLSGPRIAFKALFPDRKPQISFEEKTGFVAGNSGCNGYRAPYEVKGQDIRFGEPGPSTLMYCGEGENHFRNIIGKVDGWQLTNEGKLELLIGDVPMMRFKKLSEE